MQTTFTFRDWLIVLGYIALVTALGARFYRRKSSTQEYFLGGRAMSAVAVGISLVAADLSAISYMGIPAWAFERNWQLLPLSCTYLLVAPLAMYVFIPFYMRFRFYSGYEYLERRFDVKPRLFVAILFLLTRAGHIAIAIYTPSIALTLITGVPLYQCVLLMGIFTTFYTTVGGIRASIWTDVLQFTVLMIGALTICGFALGRIPGGLPGFYRINSEAGKFAMLNFSLDPQELTSIWAMLIGGSVMTLSAVATDQAYLQRYFTTKSVREGQRAVLLDAIIAIPVATLLFIMGSLLFAFYHGHPERLRGLPTIDATLPFFVVHELGGVFSGLIVSSIFAASMAVMSAGLNALTTVTAVDFYQRLSGRPRDDPAVVRVGRWGTVVWGAAVTAAALFANRLGPVVNACNVILGYLGGPVLGIFLLGIFTRTATASGAFWGGLIGFTLISGVAFYSAISLYYYALIGLLATFGAGYLISLVGAPPRQEQLTGLVLGLQEQIEEKV
jgi:sodium-coupled monocarboxylate transporter 8/12